MNSHDSQLFHSLSKEELMEKIILLTGEFNARETPKKRFLNLDITNQKEKVPAFYILSKRLPVIVLPKPVEYQPELSEEINFSASREPESSQEFDQNSISTSLGSFEAFKMDRKPPNQE